MNKTAASTVLLGTVLLSLWPAGGLRGWPWSTDMDLQPSMDAYERYGPPPDGSIPRGERISKPASLEEARGLTNPVEPGRDSVAHGEYLYGIYCAVCHGREAGGMGTVSAKFIPAPDITTDYYRGLPDGHFFYVVKYGSAVMPSYHESLGDTDVWDIVNYLRELQKSD